jgi:adenylylsulfate kinase
MATGDSAHVVWHAHAVGHQDRCGVLGQRGGVVWFTGLSGSGKSTIANLLDQHLLRARRAAFVLDGDNVRHGLCASKEKLLANYDEGFASRFGLGFTAADREENIRRIGCVAELLASAGLIVLTALVSPYRRDRDRVRERIEGALGTGSFMEVFVDTPIEECERRDPKGLYKQARAGAIAHFTGISDPYEPPLEPEFHLAGGSAAPDLLANEVFNGLHHRQWW